MAKGRSILAAVTVLLLLPALDGADAGETLVIDSGGARWRAQGERSVTIDLGAIDRLETRRQARTRLPPPPPVKPAEETPREPAMAERPPAASDPVRTQGALPLRPIQASPMPKAVLPRAETAPITPPLRAYTGRRAATLETKTEADASGYVPLRKREIHAPRLAPPQGRNIALAPDSGPAPARLASNPRAGAPPAPVELPKAPALQPAPPPPTAALAAKPPPLKPVEARPIAAPPPAQGAAAPATAEAPANAAPAFRLPPPPPETSAPRSAGGTALPAPAGMATTALRPTAPPRRRLTVDAAARPPVAHASDALSERLLYAPGDTTLGETERDRLLGFAAKATDSHRVEVRAFARPGDDDILARRTALSRAMEVRSFLIAAGVPPSRIAAWALSAEEEPLDRVDVVLVARS